MSAPLCPHECFACECRAILFIAGVPYVCMFIYGKLFGCIPWSFSHRGRFCSMRNCHAIAKCIWLRLGVGRRRIITLIGKGNCSPPVFPRMIRVSLQTQPLSVQMFQICSYRSVCYTYIYIYILFLLGVYRFCENPFCGSSVVVALPCASVM